MPARTSSRPSCRRWRRSTTTTRSPTFALGVGQGWRCLEIGAGDGLIARWLPGQVGGGAVVATDIETRFLAGLEALNVEVLRHDMPATVDPRPGDPFDLIHARNLLFHLPERDQVLDRLVSWLRPGGWLVEDLFMIRDLVPWSVLARFYAAVDALLAARVGSDYRWSLALPGLLRARGLDEPGSSAGTCPAE
jgi:SAM-dependent methyltransferase